MCGGGWGHTHGHWVGWGWMYGPPPPGFHWHWGEGMFWCCAPRAASRKEWLEALKKRLEERLAEINEELAKEQ